MHLTLGNAVQPTEPIKETVHHDTKPSLGHLDSIDSAALKPPEVSSPHRPHSPAHTGPSGEFSGDRSSFAHPKREGEEVKLLEASSSARGSGGSGGSASFNWASIKVGALLLSLCVDAGLYAVLPRFLAPLIPKDAGAASSMPAVHSFPPTFLPSRVHEVDAQVV